MSSLLWQVYKCICGAAIESRLLLLSYRREEILPIYPSLDVGWQVLYPSIGLFFHVCRFFPSVVCLLFTIIIGLSKCHWMRQGLVLYSCDSVAWHSGQMASSWPCSAVWTACLVSLVPVYLFQITLFITHLRCQCWCGVRLSWRSRAAQCWSISIYL